jgi:salicylate hydroxylase
MSEARSRQVIIAGAGIAGLTTALSFAVRGYPVRIFERAQKLEESGAGIQLSPNATRILDRLGVLSALRLTAVRPTAVILRDAASLAELGRVPLGAAAEARWRAPYLTLRRSDLQSALLAHVAREPGIELVTGADVKSASLHAHGVTASVETAGGTVRAGGLLLVGADGVWSGLRGLNGSKGKSSFAGELAWRRTVSADSPAAQELIKIGIAGAVTAFMHPGFHLVTYPVRGGSALNLVALTSGSSIAESWSGRMDTAQLKRAMRRTAPALRQLAEDADAWTVWPIHTVAATEPWIATGGIALVGDAAHAMTPYAAQGAAMAIEDGETLAVQVVGRQGTLGAALTAWEKQRRARVAKVVRRGATNYRAWHASGMMARMRNIYLRVHSPERLAARFDWLYGWEPPSLKV